jgi:hypothetical protein
MHDASGPTGEDHHDPQVRFSPPLHRCARHRFAHRLDDPWPRLGGKGGGFHGHHFHGGGLRVYSGIGLDGSCLRRRWVVNRFGEVVLRVVNVCY